PTRRQALQPGLRLRRLYATALHPIGPERRQHWHAILADRFDRQAISSGLLQGLRHRCRWLRQSVEDLAARPEFEFTNERADRRTLWTAPDGGNYRRHF